MADRINERSNVASAARAADFLTKLDRNRQAKVLADAAAKETKAQVTRLNGERTAIFTQAEDEGIDREALKMLDDLRQHGVEDMNRLIENVFDLARKAEVPLWREPTGERPQGELWASPEERQQKLDDMEAAAAEGDGVVAGLEGVDIDSNPHPVASLKFASWAKGHAIGAKDRAKGGPGVPPKTASPAKRPGRPPSKPAAEAAPAAAAPKTPKAAGTKPPKKAAAPKDTIGRTAGTA